MKNYGLNELREMFLSFYEARGHLRLPSFSLVPQNDKSLLLINSGMAPMKPWFTGEQEPPSRRVTTCQKCVRTGDIENIGKTSRHGTYFEMLGNFSFGDYFKEEATAWYWAFLTECVGIPESLLYPSVYNEDEEAFAIWRDKIGLPPERIARLGKADNFWEHGAGPCGPSSEVYYDRGEAHGCGSPDCGPGCDCDRFIELGNNVFSQFSNDGAGNYTELKQKNIDFGGGLERLAVVCQGVDSLFDVDTVMQITHAISAITRVTYGASGKSDASLRIITDHLRASVMLIADGVLPSNEGRGYVLRRLLRRAARNGRLLGVTEPFLRDVVETVVRVNEGAYPEVRERAAHITRVVAAEEDSFNKTIDNGIALLDEVINALQGKQISGDDAFRLYDTYGFPIDLTAEIAEERGLTVDTDRFAECMQAQRKRARDARAALGDLGWEGIDFGGDTSETAFIGYDETTAKAAVTAVIVAGELAGAATAADGADTILVLDKSPFYAEMGGQSADRGQITRAGTEFSVRDVQKTKGGKYLHYGKVLCGTFSAGDAVTARVDTVRRDAIRRAHSATHLLHAALREVLGEHVHQAGSLVEPDRLRFDFTHHESLTPQQIALAEDKVNRWTLRGDAVVTELKTPEEAKSDGATALFGEKYGEIVRVVTMGGESKELCGGTHVDNTAKIGSIRVTSEFSVASGVRRIEAVTGVEALEYARASQTELGGVLASLKAANAPEALKRIEQLTAENRELRRQAESFAAKAALGEADELLNNTADINGVKFAGTILPGGADTDELRRLGDALRDREPSIVAVFSAVSGDKLTFFAAVGKDAIAKGVKAGELVKRVSQFAGGSGGGKPDSAMGGGKDISKQADALGVAKQYVTEVTSK